MSVAEQQLWGAETPKAVENFPVSGERVPLGVVRWLARIKGAAARSTSLGKLDGDRRRSGRPPRPSPPAGTTTSS